MSCLRYDDVFKSPLVLDNSGEDIEKVRKQLGCILAKISATIQIVKEECREFRNVFILSENSLEYVTIIERQVRSQLGKRFSVEKASCQVPYENPYPNNITKEVVSVRVTRLALKKLPRSPCKSGCRIFLTLALLLFLIYFLVRLNA